MGDDNADSGSGGGDGDDSGNVGSMMVGPTVQQRWQGSDIDGDGTFGCGGGGRGGEDSNGSGDVRLVVIVVGGGNHFDLKKRKYVQDY